MRPLGTYLHDALSIVDIFEDNSDIISFIISIISLLLDNGNRTHAELGTRVPSRARAI